MAVITLLMLLTALALAAPDWTDCPSVCRCKWSSGKKTALCKSANLSAVPTTLDTDMQVLDLSHNRLHALARDQFKLAGLLNLQRVYLSHCAIDLLHRDAFRDLTILVEVDLSRNALAALHPDTFRGNERLRVLYLSGNPLRSIPAAQFPPLPHLRTLEMDECRLEGVHRDAFVHVGALETLTLRANRLRALSEAAFMGFAQLKTLGLEGNPWRCDCELRGFRDWFLSSKLRSTALLCAEPERLGGREWQAVGSEEFACAPRVAVHPLQVQAETGGNVSFGCRVAGDPEPSVAWLFEGYPINHTGLVLEAEEGLLDKWANVSVVNVSEADTGVYSCVARNALGAVAANVTVVLPEVVTATTVSKAEANLAWWGAIASAVVLGVTVIVSAVVCCARGRSRRRRRALKPSVSFRDQEKKLLDVSVATTTERSCEALAELELVEPPVHITIEGGELPLVFPPPPEFGGAMLPAGAFGNIFISVSVSREPDASSRCPDLLDLPHRGKTAYHGMATLPRRPRAMPHYDNMGPRVTAGGSSTLSLPDAEAALESRPTQTPVQVALHHHHQQQLSPEFVSL